MTIEPFITFYLVWRIRKNMKLFSPDPYWEKILFRAMIGIGVLFILDASLPIDQVTRWVWHVLILGIGYLAYRFPALERIRPIIVAVFPLVVIQIAREILAIIQPGLAKELDTYIQFAVVFALTWMIAMLIRSNKQTRALEKERQKTLVEEERNRFITAQNEKLELIVEERTAEITKQKDELLNALTDLKNTQTQLIHAEKMASLGVLTAGIAHEIQNPLNFVNNFSELNAELIVEMKNELAKGNIEDAKAIADSIVLNENKIITHGKRADAIVKGMLQHSRSSTGIKEPTNINALVDEYLRLAYHGLRAKDKSFNAALKTEYDEHIGNINIMAQDMGRVILNLITNAFYAVAPPPPQGGISDPDKNNNPTVWVSTKKVGDKVSISVRDNGPGIPQQALDKIFQPFFTTKPTGQGTGLGLSLSYDIVKAHGGEIQVVTRENEGTEFTICLPV